MGALRGNSEVSREEENISVVSVPAGEMEEAGGGALVRKGSSSGAKQLRVWCSYHDWVRVRIVLHWLVYLYPHICAGLCKDTQTSVL